jgi:endonuclease YncB( thermonuclease family)
MKTFTFPNSLIERSLDGDSHDVIAEWEEPFFILPARYPIRLRIGGVDCWDKETPRGQKALERARELVEGKRLTIETRRLYAYGGPDKKLGEWVGDIMATLETGTTMWLSQILLAEGLALPYDGKGKRPTYGLPGTL